MSQTEPAHSWILQAGDQKSSGKGRMLGGRLWLSPLADSCMASSAWEEGNRSRAPAHSPSSFPGAECFPQGVRRLWGWAAPRRVPLHGPAAALPVFYHHYLHPQPQVRSGRGAVPDSGTWPVALASTVLAGSGAGTQMHTRACVQMSAFPLPCSQWLQDPSGLTLGWAAH